MYNSRYCNYCSKKKIKVTTALFFKTIIEEKCKPFLKRFDAINKQKLKEVQKGIKKAQQDLIDKEAALCKEQKKADLAADAKDKVDIAGSKKKAKTSMK